jgi:phosphoribosylamine--glycine ligase
MHHVKDRFYRWLDELECQVAIKPDKPGQGKGVGVWGDHFQTPEQAWEHFLSLYETGDMVIVEEKEDCEEFSTQNSSDGILSFRIPRLVRDYKRAYDNDKGPNTGSMGAYSDTGLLPFVTDGEYRQTIDYDQMIFKRLKGPASRNVNLWGMSPMYNAYAITKKGLKIFEINSRPANPEFINLYPLIEDDVVDVCLSMIEGTLKPLRLRPMATVGIYLVPEPYPDRDSMQRKIGLNDAYKLAERSGGRLFVYPSAMERREDGDYALTSRTAYFLGIGDSIEEARQWALRGIATVKDPGFRYRSDIATQASIQRSIDHANALRASRAA